MTPDEIAGIKQAFSESLEPMLAKLEAIYVELGDHSEQLKGIHAVLDDHTKILDEHTRLLHSMDTRLTNVEGILDGVEILVRGGKRAG